MSGGALAAADPRHRGRPAGRGRRPFTDVAGLLRDEARLGLLYAVSGWRCCPSSSARAAASPPSTPDPDRRPPSGRPAASVRFVAWAGRVSSRARSADAPPSPSCATPRRRNRGLRRRASPFVLVVGVLSTGAVLVARSLTGSPGSGQPDPAEPPLLPGAPEPTAQPQEPPASVDGIGFDISYPQCGSADPTGAAFGIVGVNGGAPRTSNRCLAGQAEWARGLGRVRRVREHVVHRPGRSGGVRPVAHRRRDRAQAGGGARRHLDAVARRGDHQHLGGHAAGERHRARRHGLAAAGARRPRRDLLLAPAVAHDRRRLGARASGVERHLSGWLQKAATAACDESFAGSTTAIVQWVQRTDGRRLDHNVICPAWSDRAGDLLDLSGR